MNKIMTSCIAFGAGMYAYNYAQKNELITPKQMKKLQKRINKWI